MYHIYWLWKPYYQNKYSQINIIWCNNKSTYVLNVQSIFLWNDMRRSHLLPLKSFQYQSWSYHTTVLVIIIAYDKSISFLHMMLPYKRDRFYTILTRNDPSYFYNDKILRILDMFSLLKIKKMLHSDACQKTMDVSILWHK